MIDHKIQALDDERYVLVTFDEIIKFKLHERCDEIKNFLQSATQRYESQKEIEHVEISLQNLIWNSDISIMQHLEDYVYILDSQVLDEFSDITLKLKSMYFRFISIILFSILEISDLLNEYFAVSSIVTRSKIFFEVLIICFCFNLMLENFGK